MAMAMAPNTRSKRGYSSLSMALAAIISGIICCRIGIFVSCSSQWMGTQNGLQNLDSYSDAPIIGVEHRSKPKRNDRSASKVQRNDDVAAVPSNANARHHASSRSPRMQSNHYEGPPYKCGVVFFYHIPSTGGASINTWLRRYSNKKKGHGFNYFQHWESDFKGRSQKHSLLENVVQNSEANFTTGMNEHVQNLGKNEWRLAHCHINSMHMNETEYLLEQWRRTVEEEQGCKMINTIMLRDPLSHTISLHKVIQRKNSTWEEWTQFLHSPTERGLWATNLDFVLYNKGRRNPYQVTKEEKVKRAMEILNRHFDVVTVGNHGLFSELVLNMTGWKYIEMPRTNTFKGELVFTKKEVENLQKLLAANGDTEFMDAVRRRYHGYLSYLND